MRFIPIIRPELLGRETVSLEEYLEGERGGKHMTYKIDLASVTVQQNFQGKGGDSWVMKCGFQSMVKFMAEILALLTLCATSLPSTG